MSDGHPDFVILTIIDEEFKAVKEVFEKSGEVKFDERINAEDPVSSAFLEGRVGEHTIYIVKNVDRGNVKAAGLTQLILDNWRPEYLLVVGIGGAVKNVERLCGGKRGRKYINLGDVVISKDIYYGDFNVEKERIDLRSNPVTPPSANFREIAQFIINSDDEWKNYICEKRPDGKDNSTTKAYEGIILSVNEVINGEHERIRKIVCPSFRREKYIVFETESGGVGGAFYLEAQASHTSFLVIRGISDYVDDTQGVKTRKKWRKYAAQAAAAFAYELIKKIAEGSTTSSIDIDPYLKEAEKLFTEKIPVDEKALNEYYIPPKTVLVDRDTWDREVREKDGEQWSFENFLNNDKEWYIIIGAPFGMGKTTYVKHLAYKLSTNFNKYKYVPLFIRLKDWSDRDIEEDSVTTFQHELITNVIKKIVDNQAKPLLILDGLDEFNGNARSIRIWITKLHGEYPSLKAVITTRLKAGVPEELHFEKYVSILPFNEEQVMSFFTRYGLKNYDLRKVKELGLKDEDLRKPLFCWMIAMAISQIGSIENITMKGGKEKKMAFFYYILTHLLLRGKHKKVVDKRYHPTYQEEKEFLRLTAAFFNMKKSKVKYDELMKWMERVKNVPDYKLQIDIFEPFLTSYFYIRSTTEGKIVEFIHKSFQEYFLAEYYYENIRDGRVDMLNAGIPDEEVIRFLKGLIQISEDEYAIKRLGEIDSSLPRFFNCEKMIENAKRIVNEENIVINLEFYEILKKDHGSLVIAKKSKNTPLMKSLCIHRWIALTSLVCLKKKNGRIMVSKKSLISLIKETSHFIPYYLKNLKGFDLSGIDLSETDLSGANLKQADLSRTNLSRADLINAELSKANLRWANLRDAKLSNTNLSKADLRGADLSNANLSRANLSRANLSKTNLSGSVLSEADLSGTDLREAKLIKTNLINANLSKANLTGADLRGANLSRANLSKTNLSGSVLSEADLSGTDLREAILKRAIIKFLEFVFPPMSLDTIKLGRTPEEVIETLSQTDKKFRNLILKKNPKIRKIWEEFR